MWQFIKYILEKWLESDKYDVGISQLIFFLQGPEGNSVENKATVPTFKPEISTPTTSTTTETPTISFAFTKQALKSTTKEKGTFSDHTIPVTNSENSITETVLDSNDEANAFNVNNLENETLSENNIDTEMIKENDLDLTKVMVLKIFVK